MIAATIFTCAACVDTGPGYGYGPGPGYGYASGPVYAEGYGRPVGVGDYDEHHAWHDRDWWVNNNRGWVQSHHNEWLDHNAAAEHHAAEHHDRDDHDHH